MQADEPETASEPSSASEADTDEDRQEDLTEEWARQVLTAAGESCSQVTLESRAGVAGTLSRVLSVTLHYRRDGDECQLPVVVKMPPRDPFGRLFVAEAQFDTREILFYTEVKPALDRLARDTLGEQCLLPVPRCIKARLPEELGGDSELVLADATAAGFLAADFPAGLAPRRAEAALAAAARLHALSLGLRERDGPLDTKFDFLFPSERAAAGYLRLVRRGLPQLESFLRARPDCAREAAAVAELSARAPALLPALLAAAEPAPLVHADFWSGNLLFRERDDRCECLALDWQMVSLGRPMDDVALLLLSSLSPETRREYGKQLIEFYADKLEAECAAVGASEAGREARAGLRADWPRAALRALLLCAGSVEVALGEPRAEARLLAAVRDLNREGVLSYQPHVDSDTSCGTK